MKIYLSGKMTGLPDFNEPAFNKAEALFRGQGYEVFNPICLTGQFESWGEYMKRDIEELIKCDEVAVLDDWIKSRGAKLEVAIAKVLNMRVISATTRKEINLGFTISFFNKEDINSYFLTQC